MTNNIKDMYKGTIIENSLNDKDILKRLIINRTWQDGSWVLHDVSIKEDQISELSKHMNIGPWYIHVWEQGKEDIKVIFKDKVFNIKSTDKSTWSDAINYGKSIGIPVKQLDFPIN